MRLPEEKLSLAIGYKARKTLVHMILMVAVEKCIAGIVGHEVILALFVIASSMIVSAVVR